MKSSNQKIFKGVSHSYLNPLKTKPFAVAALVFGLAFAVAHPSHAKKSHVLTSDDFNSLIQEGIQTQNQIAPPVDTRNELHRGPNYKTEEFRQQIVSVEGSPAPVISRSTANQEIEKQERESIKEAQKKRLQRTSMEMRSINSL